VPPEDQALPILGVRPADVPDVAIVVGDPERARETATLLDETVELASNREYLTLVGSRDGVRICVASHGVGASGALVCFAELIKAGVGTLIRAGTCGAISFGIQDGEVLIATAAVREDGASDQLIGAAYPAVADRDVTRSLVRSAEARGRSCREGLVVTEAIFYPGAFPPRWQSYTDHGAMAVEMEMSALFVIASMNSVRAGGILTVDGNLVDTRSADMSDYDPHRQVVASGVSDMLEIAVDSAAALGGEAPTTPENTSG